MPRTLKVLKAEWWLGGSGSVAIELQQTLLKGYAIRKLELWMTLRILDVGVRGHISLAKNVLDSFRASSR